MSAIQAEATATTANSPAPSTFEKLMSSAAAEHDRQVQELRTELTRLRETLEQAVLTDATVDTIDYLLRFDTSRAVGGAKKCNGSVDDKPKPKAENLTLPGLVPDAQGKQAVADMDSLEVNSLRSDDTTDIPRKKRSKAQQSEGLETRDFSGVLPEQVRNSSSKSIVDAEQAQRKEPKTAFDVEAPQEDHMCQSVVQEPEEDVNEVNSPNKVHRNIIQYSKSGIGNSLERRHSAIEKVTRMFGVENTPKLQWKTTMVWGDTVKRRCLWQFMNHAYVKVGCSLIIACNAIFIGQHSDAVVHAVLTGTEEPLIYDVMEYVFTGWFALELVLRVGGEHFLFFHGPEWKWNMVDTMLVLLNFIELIGSTSMPNFTFARLLRIFRFARILRIVRVMRVCQSFRVMLFAILYSMTSLLWVMVVLVFFQYCFAIFFLHGVSETFLYAPSSISAREATVLKRDFGCITSILMSLFMAITGGVDWREMMETLMAMHWLYGYGFVFYMALMTFVVMNVVVGAVVKTTSHCYNKDRQLVITDEIERLKEYTAQIKVFFYEADQDRSGTLSWEEFESHMQDTKVKAFFQSLDLDVSQAHTLFDLLDADGSNEVGVDEFIDGCWRLKGEARSIDVNRQLLMMERIHSTVHDLKAQIERMARNKLLPGNSDYVKLIPTTTENLTELPIRSPVPAVGKSVT